MKKFKLIFGFIFIFSLMMSAQENKVILAEYQDIAKVFSQQDNGSVSNFTLNCPIEDIKAMKEETQKYGDYLSFVAIKHATKTTSFNCTLSFSHDAQPMEFYKMMLSMGITGVKIADIDLPLENLLSIK